MSFSIIARLRSVMHNSSLSGSILNVFCSISQNTGTHNHCSMLVTVLHMFQGLTIISSPGSSCRLPTAISSPLLQLLTAIACLTLNCLHILCSSCCTLGPPKKRLPQLALNPLSVPDSSTLVTADISRFPIVLICFNA